MVVNRAPVSHCAGTGLRDRERSAASREENPAPRDNRAGGAIPVVPCARRPRQSRSRPGFPPGTKLRSRPPHPHRTIQVSAQTPCRSDESGKKPRDKRERGIARPKVIERDVATEPPQTSGALRTWTESLISNDSVISNFYQGRGYPSRTRSPISTIRAGSPWSILFRRHSEQPGRQCRDPAICVIAGKPRVSPSRRAR